MAASGTVIQASRTGRSLVERVSPVTESLSLATPPMSPAIRRGTFGPCLPWSSIRWPSRSASSARLFQTLESAGRVPETTRRIETLPVKGSERVLKTSTASGPAGSPASAMSSPPTFLAGKVRSGGEGSRARKASSSAEGPMP